MDTPHTSCQLREYLGNRFVYAAISQRAGGLLLGIEMTPNQKCNYDCVYCYVKRDPANARRMFNVRVMLAELKELLQMHRLGRFKELSIFSKVPDELLRLKGVALSGEGEPTLCHCFAEVVSEIVNLRATAQWPDFKLMLITNGSGLNQQPVRQGLRQFRTSDEIWVKLDAGTDEAMRRINRTRVTADAVVNNMVAMGQWRPIFVQSFFCAFEGVEPREDEIDAYIRTLAEARERGASIAGVQIYSVVRPPANPACTRLPLNQLSSIARRVRAETGLCAEVY